MHVMWGFTYKYVQADVYPPLSPLLINMTRDSLLGTQILFESWIFVQDQINSSSARGKLGTHYT